MPGPCKDSEEILNILKAFWIFNNGKKKHKLNSEKTV